MLRLIGLALGALGCNLPLLRSTPIPGVPEGAEPPPPPPETALETPPSGAVPPTVEPTAGPPTAVPPTPIPALFIIDAHQDIAWNWLEFERDPRESALTVQERERGGTIESFVGRRTTGLPEYVAGRIGIIFATLFVMPSRRAWDASMTEVYSDVQEAHDRAMAQLAAYEQLAASEPGICLVASRETLDQVAGAWLNPGAEAPCVGLVLAMEGADPIRQPAEVADWYARGLRIVGPAWAETQYAGGNGEPAPLSEAGRQLLDEMSRLNMILDLSHIAPDSFFEAVEHYPGVVIASHSNPRAFLPTDRGLTDEMIQAIAGRGGAIGLVAYNRYLHPGWEYGDARVPLATFADAIDYVVQLTGSIDHAAIGSDFDGGFGVESIPDGLDTAADLIGVADVLAARGYTEDHIAAILYGNWLRVLRAAL